MVDERRLYCDFKYGSLYTYAIKALGYSEGEAYRRVKASRLLKDFPEVKEKIQKGKLTLTNAAILEGFFKNSSKNLLEKRKLIKVCEGKSSREVTHILSPPKLGKKKILTVRVGEETLKKIEKLRGLLAHKLPQASLEELFEFSLDQAISNATLRSRKIKRIWDRDGGKCSNCGSGYALEVDHINPKALGGGNEPKNLRLLCRSCNGRAAVKVFGEKKMRSFL